MKNTYLKLLLGLCFVLGLQLSYAQINEIKIKFIGNCGLYMTDGELDIYVDFPYKSGAYNYMEYDAKELEEVKENAIFLFTHKHADHYSGKIMRKVLKEKNGEKYGKWNIAKMQKMCDGIEGFSIEPIKTKHRFSFSHYSYMITWHGKKIYLSGDTESADTVLGKNDMDWAFVPIWVVLDAIEKGKQIDAKQIGIYHLYPTETVDNQNPDRIKVLDKQGEVMTIQY